MVRWNLYINNENAYAYAYYYQHKFSTLKCSYAHTRVQMVYGYFWEEATHLISLLLT